ncbi:MAG: ATP-binding protein [Acidimicrobiales bacterium]
MAATAARTGANPSNPYTPDWGVGPPVLVGRDEHLDRAERALRGGPRDFWFTHAYYGERGVGKTVLLDAIGERAARLGWPVVHTAVRAGRFLAPLVFLGLPEAMARLRRRSRLNRGDLTITAGVDLGVIKAEASQRRRRDRDLPIDAELELGLRKVGEVAADKGRGALVTVDEIHAAKPRELIVFSQTMQLVTKRRGLPVALIVAGLPDVASLLTGSELTFLERMPKIELGFLGPDATRLALTKPAADLGVRFTDGALDLLAETSAGYPYFVQLLGYHAWEARRTRIVDHEAATAAVKEATRMASDQVFAPRWRRLAPKEREFLRAMADVLAVDGEVPIADVRERLGAETYEEISYLRVRLLQKGVVRPAGRGLLRFTFPGMADWVRTVQ